MKIIPKEIIDAENEKRIAFSLAEQAVIKKILELNMNYSEALNDDEVKSLISIADEKAAVVKYENWKDELQKKVIRAKKQKEIKK